MVIRIGQINAQRSAAPPANIEILIKERNLDILCLQEPFYFEGKVRGYNTPNLIKLQPQNCEMAWVTAVVKNDKVDALVNVGYESENMCFKVMAGDHVIVIINVYCQYSLPLEGFLGRIERILKSLQGEKVL